MGLCIVVFATREAMVSFVSKKKRIHKFICVNKQAPIQELTPL